MRFIITNVLIAYIALLGIAYFLSDQMIFIPPKSGYYDSEQYLKLTTADHNTIFASYLPHKNAKYTILFSHGNAEDIGYLQPFFKKMHQSGFAVFGYDYHGYGLSTGKPTERNTYLDIDAAYDYLTKVLHVSPENIIVFGHSVGAAVSLDLAVRKPVAAVILQGAFVTAFRVVTKIPIIPFDKFANLRKIKQLQQPLLMIHGTNDTIIPFWHAQKLYGNAVSKKKFYVVKNAGHNDIVNVAGEEYWETISDFVRQYLPVK